MNLNNTDLNLFIAFDVIYTERNLTKAGEVLGITQPA
ncbi:MAG: LysR family transcriptional regulator, partial [Gammaproteobacteria bacterium]